MHSHGLRGATAGSGQPGRCQAAGAIAWSQAAGNAAARAQGCVDGPPGSALPDQPSSTCATAPRVSTVSDARTVCCAEAGADGEELLQPLEAGISHLLLGGSWECRLGGLTAAKVSHAMPLLLRALHPAPAPPSPADPAPARRHRRSSPILTTLVPLSCLQRLLPAHTGAHLPARPPRLRAADAVRGAGSAGGR